MKGKRRRLGCLDFQRVVDGQAGPRNLFGVLLDDGDRLYCGILLYGEGYQRLAMHDFPPTLLVNERAILLPPPDGMLYVIGPALHLYRVQVRAETLEEHLNSDSLADFFRSSDWINLLLPVLEVNEWAR